MAENSYSVVGKSVPRIDALGKVTGATRFCSDVRLQGMLYGKVLRSPHPHARIISIDTSRAESVPGVRGIVTGRDAPEKRSGMMRYAFDQYLLARDEVLFAGEAVAAVAADALEIAEKAADLIDVKYEELPAAFDVEEAWEKHPPVVLHPDLSTYQQAPFVHLDPDRPNVCNHHRVVQGDVDQGFRNADIIMENRFTTARMQHVALEPHTCIASFDIDGGLTIWSGRQGLYGARESLRRALDLPAAKVRIISSFYLGGAFGSKFMLTVEPAAILLAKKTGRPVRVSMTREEIFAAGGNRIPCIINIKDGVKKDGMLVAREMRILVDTGAYAASGGAVLTRNGSFAALGTYRVPNFKFDAYGVYTNQPPVCALRGFASEQPIWAIESQMDMLAEKLGMDGVALRQKNLLKEGDTNANGQIVHSIGAGECLEKVAAHLKEKTPRFVSVSSWRRGQGLALGCKYSHASTASISMVKVSGDGTIEVRFSADDLGQGCNMMVAQIAAEEFGVTVDHVRITWGDTAISPYSTQTLSQGTTFNTGNSTRMACLDAKRQLYQVAARKLGVSPEELETREGKVMVKAAPERAITIAELYKKGYVEQFGEILGRGLFVHPGTMEDENGRIDPALAQQGVGLAAFFSYIAQGAQVAVNVETGEVKIEDFVSAVDMGFPINPGMCEQQVDGGASMGIGSALWEKMKMERGIVLNANLRDYKIPDATSLPNNEHFKVFLTPVAHKNGPYGAKGMGEVVLTPTAPAIANAVYNAVGIRLKDLPLGREEVLKAIREREPAKRR